MAVAGVDSALFVLGATLAAVGFILVVFLANSLLSPRRPTDEKLRPYECGMELAGEPWVASRVRFAQFAMLLVILDAQVALLFGVATRIKGAPVAALSVGAFVGLLALGLAYAWRKGALEWR